MKKEKYALYGILAAALISLIGVIITSITQTKIQWIAVTQTAQSISSTETAIPRSTRLIISDSFENNKNNWSLGDNAYNAYYSDVSIESGTLQRLMNTNDSNGSWGTITIPGINEKNFCLILDIKVKDVSDSVAIVIVTRATNYGDKDKSNYLRFQLLDNGESSVWAKINSENEQRIAQFKSASLNDNLPHRISISLQDNIIDIFEPVTSETHEKIVLDQDTLLEAGQIRLGVRHSQSVSKRNCGI